MAYISTVAHSTPSTPFGNFVASVKSAWADYKVYRATIEELVALTDRELSDLGIARCQIKSIALDAAYNK